MKVSIFRQKQVREILLLLLTVLLLILIFSGCGFSLFPESSAKNEIEHWNYVDYDAPALRLAEPVKAKLKAKVVDEDGTVRWVYIGVGELPAGTYVKGQKPSKVEWEERKK